MTKKKVSQKAEASLLEESQLENEEDIMKKEANTETKKAAIKKIKNEKHTLCYLASKANYIIEIVVNGKKSYIQPFGKIKVIKEQIKLNSNDTKYLTFIKI